MRERVIRDEIHKDILVPFQHARIIDTKEFQRLRSIQQLSTCEYVFPAANHNRFSHSLGAYHLACKLTQLIQEVQPGIIDDDDAELVQLLHCCTILAIHHILIYWRLQKCLQLSILMSIGADYFLNRRKQKLVESLRIYWEVNVLGVYLQ